MPLLDENFNGLCSTRQFWCFGFLLIEVLSSSAALSKLDIQTLLWQNTCLLLTTSNICMTISLSVYPAVLCVPSSHSALKACTGTLLKPVKGSPVSDLHSGPQCSHRSSLRLLKTAWVPLFQGMVFLFNSGRYFSITTRHRSAILYWFTALWSAIDYSLSAFSKWSCYRHAAHAQANVQETVTAVAGRKIFKSDIDACVPKAKSICR